ncbi:MAG: class I mannose-6-phosphate isomerase [Acetobacter sp.]|nr:class I mannose-6-phosphate isomerase [Bacteroides sp.]MCM1340616.1 class I mannose-6-phosphate isomerase [Acetobacter sp.]MCM1433728.1 class I mannose-6-phosphate isomerase [Clostridiales bacterium]
MEIMKLSPVFKDYIWGGQRLKTDFGFTSDYDKVAEGWMLSCHKDGKNIIENGKYKGETLDSVIKKIGKEKIVGTKSLDFPYFPVLIKLIDAKDNLSIQVHPDNEYAKRVENEFGKTEIWYVLDAEEDAQLVYGFKEKISSEKFRKAIEENTLTDVLNTVNVKKGDLFFIEAGTVHAIGKGTLIAEIQQNSNSTYRVYDYGRVGADGKPRELHIDKAVDVSVTEPPKYEIKPFGETVVTDEAESTLLTKCDLFTVNHYNVKTKISLSTGKESFNHILVVDGNGKLNDINIKKGDSFFVPANFGKYEISGKCEIIITNI